MRNPEFADAPLTRQTIKPQGKIILVRLFCSFSASSYPKAVMLPEDSTRETDNLLEIPDNYPKYVVTLDRLAAGNENGVRIVYLEDFLLAGTW